MRRIVIRIDARGARVGIPPGRREHVEARGPRVEGVPGARVVRRRRAVDTAVEVVGVATARARDGDVLRPVRQIRVRRAAQSVVAGCREERDRGAGHGPETGAEDRAHRRSDLLQVAVIRLAARGVAVVAGRDGEADPAARERSEHVLLIRIVAVRVDEPPVSEDCEREGLRGACRCLRAEVGGIAGAEQVGAAEHYPVAIPARARERERGLPLVLAHGPHLDRRACRALDRRERAGRAVERPVRHRGSRSRLVGREVHDHVQADQVRQVRRPGEVRVVVRRSRRFHRSGHGKEHGENRRENRPHRQMIARARSSGNASSGPLSAATRRTDVVALHLCRPGEGFSRFRVASAEHPRHTRLP